MDMTMTVQIFCPNCGSVKVKKNGHIHNGKQNHQCKDCKREFVLNPTNITISSDKKGLIKRLLLERISLHGICRATGVSLTWLLQYIVKLYAQLPDDLNFVEINDNSSLIIYPYKNETDEMWSFVGDKDNKKWIWIALDLSTRQIVAFFVGDRSKNSAKALWDRIPINYRKNATFYTDEYEAYNSVIPANQHVSGPKQDGITCHIERFNCTVRQRVSRLVRLALSFSKKLENHIGAIKYFICNYNLEKAAALHV